MYVSIHVQIKTKIKTNILEAYYSILNCEFKFER